MKLTFYGAARTVTGSQHLLEVNGSRVLLECGLFQGHRQETFERNCYFSYNPKWLDAVILSHAHIDHSGNLPNLVSQGYHNPIYATEATVHLSRLMLLDSAHIQEVDAAYVNKKRQRNGQPPAEPLYTTQQATETLQYFHPLPYGKTFEPAPGVTAHFEDAGHILGSAALVLDIEEKGRKFRLWFSGDIGRRDLHLLRDPVLPQDADYLVMECTYGDKPHRDPEMAYAELRSVIIRTINQGGKVIIPAFAVGRTQELVYDLNRMMDKGEVPHIPVYVDSPLAVNLSDVYLEHPECFDAETNAFINDGRHKSALGFDTLTYVRSLDESKALNDRKGPMVIISAAGMAENGRIRHHLANNIENPKNTVLIVSWQAPDTLGRRLADRERFVKIFGETYECRAKIETIGGFSAHAGQDFLMEYAQASRDTLKKIALVHGEKKPAEALQEKLAEAGLAEVSYPDIGDCLEV